MGAPSIIAAVEFRREPAGALQNTRTLGGRGESAAPLGEGAYNPTLRDMMVRRPLRGLQVKKDTPATLVVLGPSGVGGEVYNSSAAGTSRVSFTSNFIVQAFDISRSEKMQIVQTFGPAYGFFFGEQPYFVQVQALLVDSEDFPWVVEWWANYDEKLRGTRLVDAGMQVYLEIEGFVFGGYLSAARLGKTSAEQHQVPISFSMWVTSADTTEIPGGRGLEDYERAGGGWEPFNLAPTNSATGAEVPSSSALVRQANLQQGVATSLLGFLRGLEDTGQGYVNSKIAQGRNLLYGRNIRIPAGFAGSEVNAGAATFASGSGEDAVIARGNFVTVRLPPEFTAVQAGPRRSDFYDNRDEYPLRGDSGAYSEEEVRTAFDRTFTGLGGGASSADEGGAQLGTRDIISIAEQKWRQSGFPLVTNQAGGGVPELGLAAARVAYGVLSLSAAIATEAARANAAEADAAARAAGLPRPPRGQGDLVASALGDSLGLGR